MNIQSILRPLSALETPWLVVGVFDDGLEPPASTKELPLGERVGRLLSVKEISGGLGETTVLHGPLSPAEEGVLVVGL
ncbi:M17 family peptidase N-terminal domain-containing protein, partial [Singulisphaera rosea]